MRLLVMALALKKQRRLISSNIFVFLHFDISHADSLTDLIRLIEQVRSTPRKKRGIYWTKVSIDTLVLVGALNEVRYQPSQKSKRNVKRKLPSLRIVNKAVGYLGVLNTIGNQPTTDINYDGHCAWSGASSSRGASTGKDCKRERSHRAN